MVPGVKNDCRSCVGKSLSFNVVARLIRTVAKPVKIALGECKVGARSDGRWQSLDAVTAAMDEALVGLLLVRRGALESCGQDNYILD